MAADATVAIPVLNGARYLREVLAAVRAQRVDREVELLIVDSGSTDGSLEIAEEHGARIHRIHKSEFSHGGTRNEGQGLERTPEQLAAYRRFPGRWTFFSDVNGCVARWAWRRIPYREVPYAEDQLLGREVIEAGLAKVFHPDARVLHSHDYPPAQFLRRYFDEFRSLREVLDHVERAHPVRTPQTVRGLVGHDRRWLRRHGVHGRALVRPLAVSLRHHTIRQTGAIVGTRADRVPRRLRRALSLEGRDSFVPYEIPESPLLAGPTQPDSRPTELDPGWPWRFVAEAHPAREGST